MSRTIEIIGGGPAGLYAGYLLKLRDPELQVTVHERMAGDQTFGFGVGLTESTMRNLDAADPATAEELRAFSYAGHDLRLVTEHGSAQLHGARNLAIGRSTLLQVLGKAARSAGVEIRQGSSVEASQLDADVIIAADGVGSRTRAALASELDVSERLGRTRFVWCGADFAVDSAFFSAARRGDGLFVLHAYPYAEDRSTFLIEVDEVTWKAAGLQANDDRTPPGESDEASVALLEEVFASELRGRSLLTNRTRWSQFSNIDVPHWSKRNVVLVGDAAHTAHYTLGSGTKLALEDSIALVDALIGESSVPAAFAAYETTRRPPIERFKKLAHRSQAWWDSYRLRADLPAERLALSYMTRSGNIGLSNYTTEELSNTRRALSWLGDDVPSRGEAIEDWVLTRPLSTPGGQRFQRLFTREELTSLTPMDEVAWSDPEVWGSEADKVCRTLDDPEQRPVLVTGPSTPEAAAARIDLAERLRLEGSRLVGVELPSENSHSTTATAVAAARIDFAVTT